MLARPVELQYLEVVPALETLVQRQEATLLLLLLRIPAIAVSMQCRKLDMQVSREPV